jgi:Uma2 family endonuclease
LHDFPSADYDDVAEPDEEERTMSTLRRRSSLLERGPVIYPDSDGKPMGETSAHVLNIRWTIEPIETWFAADANVFIAANMFLYYVEGNPRKHVSPDLFVVKGVPKEPGRRSYRVWDEGGKRPDVVVEFTSASTRREDTEKKFELYRDVLKVGEYFLFDPYDEYLHPRLQGYRLARGRYVRIKPVDGRLRSKLLGLDLEADSELLRFINPATGKRLQIPPEVEHESSRNAEARRLAEEEARRSNEARQLAEEENSRLRREVDELRGQQQTPS